MRNITSTINKLSEYDAKRSKDAGTSFDEKLFLFSTVQMLRPKSILEIGVSAGHATLWLAAAAKTVGAKMTSIDNWSAAHGGKAKGPEKAKKRLDDNGLLDVVNFVATDSVPYLKAIAENSIDLVWVDGDHSLSGAIADMTEAIRVARQLVLVHDTNQRAYTTVREACLNVCDRGCFFDSLRGMFMITPREEVKK